MLARFILVAGAALTLGACGFAQNTNVSTSSIAYAPVEQTAPQTPLPTPAASTSAALSATEVEGFIDPQAVSLMKSGDRTEAASAQFYALQFGRPGAPRSWQGPSGVSGQVSVGPYVRVNNLDCREFTHKVDANGGSFSRKGTACREADGRWSVVTVANG